MKSIVENCEGFEWDEGNSNKNFYLHGVTDGECEDVFFNLPLIIAADKAHSKDRKKIFRAWQNRCKSSGFYCFYGAKQIDSGNFRPRYDEK